MKKNLFILFIILGTLTFLTPAQATTIRYDIYGVLTEINNGSHYDVGDQLYAWLEFDESLLEKYPNGSNRYVADI